jgi:oligopeptide/dipeptide ABC transporter ATP-binding protein
MTAPGARPAEDRPPLLEARGLTRHFKVGGAIARKTLHAVDDANFTIGEREIVALVGESGSGKSTVARLLARVYKPTAGAILYQGRPLSALRSRKDLQERLGFAVVFVTHDMSLVSHFSDRLVVMYAAQAVEIGPTRDVFAAPGHPYTRGLLEAFPSIHGPRVPLTGIPGSPPNLLHPPTGCRFKPRCPHRFELCDAPPPLYDAGGSLAACHLHAPEVREAVR